MVYAENENVSEDNILALQVLAFSYTHCMDLIKGIRCTSVQLTLSSDPFSDISCLVLPQQYFFFVCGNG